MTHGVASLCGTAARGDGLARSLGSGNEPNSLDSGLDAWIVLRKLNEHKRVATRGCRKRKGRYRNSGPEVLLFDLRRLNQNPIPITKEVMKKRSGRRGRTFEAKALQAYLSV